jgi:hypothetical protein
MDYLLRTTTEAQMDDALEAAGILVEQNIGEGQLALVPVPGAYLDQIGPCGADTRYHVNLRITDGVVYDEDELPTFAPLPVTPYRVWFDG